MLVTVSRSMPFPLFPSSSLGLEPNLISGLPQLSTMTCLEIWGKSYRNHEKAKDIWLSLPQTTLTNL